MSTKPITREVTEADKVKVTPKENMTTEPIIPTVTEAIEIEVVPRKLVLYYWESEGDPPRYVFIRLREDDKDDDSLVALYRLLETFNIDTERAMDRWSKIRAMKLPFWVERKLRIRYRLIKLKELEWFADE